VAVEEKARPRNCVGRIYARIKRVAESKRFSWEGGRGFKEKNGTVKEREERGAVIV